LVYRLFLKDYLIAVTWTEKYLYLMSLRAPRGNLFKRLSRLQGIAMRRPQ